MNYNTLSELEKDEHPNGILSMNQLFELQRLSSTRTVMFVDVKSVRESAVQFLTNPQNAKEYPNISKSVATLKKLGHI
jgi:hypothetical protein